MNLFIATAAAAFVLQMTLMAQRNTSGAAHARTEFRFTVNLGYDEAFGLFGALGERNWAPDWRPQFLYPNPPADIAGAVFLITDRPSHSSVWMTTKFERATGEIQHVFILNHIIISRIDIKITREHDDKTGVFVAYEWTALEASAGEHVTRLAKQHEKSADEWKAAIDAYAAKLRTQNAR